MSSTQTITRSPIASRIPGLQALWNATLGSDEILVAILDGKCDRVHPEFANFSWCQWAGLSFPRRWESIREQDIRC